MLYSYSTAGLVIGLLLSKQSVTVSLRNGCAKSQQNQSKNDLVFRPFDFLSSSFVGPKIFRKEVGRGV